MKPIPEETRRFVKLCVPLTGFAEFDLYSTGMAQLYLDTARERIGPARFDAFLEALAKASTPRVDVKKLRSTDREIARAVAYLWYTGAWPRLAEAVHTELRPKKPNDEFVVKPSSYVEGLVWRTFHGHPAGAKPPGYASWSVKPAPPLSLAQIEEECGLDKTTTKAETYRRDAGPDSGVELDEAAPADIAPHLLPGPMVARDIPPSAVPPAQTPEAEGTTA